MRIPRKPSSGDGRRKIIQLTEKCTDLDKKLTEGMISVENQMTYGFLSQEKLLLEFC